MTQTVKNHSKAQRTFTTNRTNFKTSLQYEGLKISNDNVGKSVGELKQKYAR